MKRRLRFDEARDTPVVVGRTCAECEHPIIEDECLKCPLCGTTLPDEGDDESPRGSLWDVIVTKWPSASPLARRNALSAWARGKIERRLGLLWDPKKSRLTRPHGEHAHVVPDLRKLTRTELVKLLDYVDVLQLGSRPTPGPLGTSSRFLSLMEFTWLSLASRHWPKPQRRGLGPLGILHAEREAMKKARDRHGQKPVTMPEGDEDSAALLARANEHLVSSRDGKWINWAVQRGKLDRKKRP